MGHQIVEGPRLPSEPEPLALHHSRAEVHDQIQGLLTLQNMESGVPSVDVDPVVRLQLRAIHLEDFLPQIELIQNLDMHTS